MRTPVVASLILTACATTSPVPPQATKEEAEAISACESARTTYLGTLVNTCVTSADCEMLGPRISGACGVARSHMPKATDHMAAIRAACDHVPQSLPWCEPEVATCVLGVCRAVKEDVAECAQTTAALVELLRKESQGCTTNDECVLVSSGLESLAVSRATLEAHSDQQQRRKQSCAHQLRVSKHALCEHHQCTEPSSSIDGLVPPKFDVDCLSDAIRRIHPAYRGMLKFKGTVFADGRANYFRRIIGPEGFTNAVGEKLSQCPFRPATYRGAPIDLDYVFNFSIQ